jgi:hypothetical protein
VPFRSTPTRFLVKHSPNSEQANGIYCNCRHFFAASQGVFAQFLVPIISYPIACPAGAVTIPDLRQTPSVNGQWLRTHLEQVSGHEAIDAVEFDDQRLTLMVSKL